MSLAKAIENLVIAASRMVAAIESDANSRLHQSSIAALLMLVAGSATGLPSPKHRGDHFQGDVELYVNVNMIGNKTIRPLAFVTVSVLGSRRQSLDATWIVWPRTIRQTRWPDGSLCLTIEEPGLVTVGAFFIEGETSGFLKRSISVAGR